MRLKEVVFTEAVPIDGYGVGFFRIADKAHAAPLTITPEGVLSWDGYDDAEALLSVANDLDVFLIGTGNEIAYIPPALRIALESAGVGVEIMGSAQACRTYNVLLGEGRRVGVALMPITET